MKNTKKMHTLFGHIYNDKKIIRQMHNSL